MKGLSWQWQKKGRFYIAKLNAIPPFMELNESTLKDEQNELMMSSLAQFVQDLGLIEKARPKAIF